MSHCDWLDGTHILMCRESARRHFSMSYKNDSFDLFEAMEDVDLGDDLNG